MLERRPHPHVVEIFFYDSQAIKNGGSTDDRRSVLIVMENRCSCARAVSVQYRNIPALNVFAEVHAAKGRLQRCDQYFR